jgi:hypothetical protein
MVRLPHRVTHSFTYERTHEERANNSLMKKAGIASNYSR